MDMAEGCVLHVGQGLRREGVKLTDRKAALRLAGSGAGYESVTGKRSAN